MIDETKNAIKTSIDQQVGRCCYGGLKTRAGCGSCAAWQAHTSQTCDVCGLLHGVGKSDRIVEVKASNV